MASKYIHTIDGKPASFDGEQICFVRPGIKLSELLVDDLSTIRRQQKASALYRYQVIKDYTDFGYGYLRVTA